MNKNIIIGERVTRKGKNSQAYFSGGKFSSQHLVFTVVTTNKKIYWLLTGMGDYPENLPCSSYFLREGSASLTSESAASGLVPGTLIDNRLVYAK